MSAANAFDRLDTVLYAYLNQHQRSRLSRNLTTIKIALAALLGMTTGDLEIVAILCKAKEGVSKVTDGLRDELSYAANTNGTDRAGAMLYRLEELCSDGLQQYVDAYIEKYEGLSDAGRLATMRRALLAATNVLKELESE